jgi:HK97 family phage major capsid protein
MSTAELDEARDEVLERLDSDDATQDDADDADALTAEIEARGRVAQRRARLAQGLRDGSARTTAGQRRPDQESDDPQVRADAGGPGALLMASDGWRAFAANGGRGKFTTTIDTRAVLTTGTAPVIERTPFPPTAVTLPSLMLDIIANQPTTAGKIEWIGETAASSADLDGGATTVVEGALKPEATIAVEPLSADVETIATWVDLTRALYDDNGGLTGWLNNRLRAAVRAVLDAQVVSGNGTDPNLRGLLATPGVQTLTPTVDDGLAVAARKAMTLIQNRGQLATHVVANPVDAENNDLAVNQQGDLLDYGALNLPPVITDPNMPAGEFVVGSFTSDNIALRVRLATAILLSDSAGPNGQGFKMNILTILAETRAALCVWNPANFVKGTLTVTGARTARAKG